MLLSEVFFLHNPVWIPLSVLIPGVGLAPSLDPTGNGTPTSSALVVACDSQRKTHTYPYNIQICIPADLSP